MKATFYTDNKSFTTLKEAKDYAIKHEAPEVGMSIGGLYKNIFQYSPMSERLERVSRVNDVRKSMNKFLKSYQEN